MEDLKDYWLSKLQERTNDNWFHKKQELYKERDVEIVRVKGKGHVYRSLTYDRKRTHTYALHLMYVLNQKDQMFVEEEVQHFEFSKGDDTDHRKLIKLSSEETPKTSPNQDTVADRERFYYDREAAVRYAEIWWNSYNPAFRQFEVDCTNYVSQCLYAGGAPMRGAPNRGTGWWYQNQHENWSYSWAVAHSMRWYLSGSTQGLVATEVEDASMLIPGDVICYDFQGDGRWDHNTIVVTKDYYDQPLVNAHTDNSRHRYWSYEDSTAYTPNIQYKFFRIGDK